MSFLFANNANSTLAAPISSTATSLSVAAGAGSNFPNPTGGATFSATLVDKATGLLREIVYVTAVSSDTFTTVARGQEGTTAVSWNAGDYVQNLVTNGALSAFVQSDSVQAKVNPIYPPLLSTGEIQGVSGIWSCIGVPSDANGNDYDYCFRSDGVGSGNHIYHKEAGSWVGLI